MSVANAVVVLADGRKIPLFVRNDGYCDYAGAYVTTFYSDGRLRKSWFCSERHEQYVCPAPDLRLAHDMRVLEAPVERHFGIAFEDLIDLD